MKISRFLLGKLILFIDALPRPPPMQRPAEAQAGIDAQTAPRALYQYLACPFCVKVRRHIRRLNLNIDTRDAKGNETYKNELLEQGGKAQVPCLKIEEPGQPVQWLYESDAIITYLDKHFT
jgi:glutaredoxin